MVYAQGLLFAEWIDVFGESRSVTASVGTLATAVMEGAGVLTGALIARYGEQRCCFAGGVIAGTGLLLSSFATKIWHLHLTFSLLVGLGHSLSLFSGAVAVNRWFYKRRSLVSGLGNTGSGTGTLLFGLFVPAIIADGGGRADTGGDGWRAGLRALAAITFALLCGVAPLLRHPTEADVEAAAQVAAVAATTYRKPSLTAAALAHTRGTDDTTTVPVTIAAEPVGAKDETGPSPGSVVSIGELLRIRALQPVLPPRRISHCTGKFAK